MRKKANYVAYAQMPGYQKRVNLRLTPKQIDTKGFLTDFGRICHVKLHTKSLLHSDIGNGVISKMASTRVSRHIPIHIQSRKVVFACLALNKAMKSIQLSNGNYY